MKRWQPHACGGTPTSCLRSPNVELCFLSFLFGAKTRPSKTTLRYCIKCVSVCEGCVVCINANGLKPGFLWIGHSFTTETKIQFCANAQRAIPVKRVKMLEESVSMTSKKIPRLVSKNKKDTKLPFLLDVQNLALVRLRLDSVQARWNAGPHKLHICAKLKYCSCCINTQCCFLGYWSNNAAARPPNIKCQKKVGKILYVTVRCETELQRRMSWPSQHETPCFWIEPWHYYRTHRTGLGWENNATIVGQVEVFPHMQNLHDNSWALSRCCSCWSDSEKQPRYGARWWKGNTTTWNETYLPLALCCWQIRERHIERHKYKTVGKDKKNVINYL